jgi:Asp-tRNA(Asn)/Glu-tRNA(Gln) amidotransferase A subunit family amidase
MPEELIKLSATAMARGVRERAFSPVELVRAHLQQIDRLNPVLNAFVQVREEEAMREAQAAELQLSSADELGPLYGVPVSIKACIDVQGMRCESGSRLRAGVIAQTDAVLVRRLRAAGAIVLGTTNTPEMLMAYETSNRLNGTTNSPWDRERTPGGSSGGEASAIAACMSAGGIGSDAGGSVRVPAHYSGICALKPTPGRIPATGHFPESLGPFALLGVVGPMARWIEDLKVMFRCIAGPDDGDTSSAPVPILAPEKEDLRRMRIGYLEEDPGLCVVDPEIIAAVRMAVHALRAQGFVVEPVRPGYLQRAREHWWTIFVRLGAELNRDMFAGREHDISPVLADFLAIAAADRTLTKEMLLQAWFERDQLRIEMMRHMSEIPFLITPAAATTAFKHGERSWNIGRNRVDYLDTMSYSQVWNLLGNPAAVVPVTRSKSGLPIGIQVVGRPYEEGGVLAIAAQVEQEFGFHEPPLLRDEATIVAKR